jgi:uncharacterized Zn-finger protein
VTTADNPTDSVPARRHRVASFVTNVADIRDIVLADNESGAGYLKFGNDRGVPESCTGARKIKCIGESPPQDHPHIYINMGEGATIPCPYAAHGSASILDWRRSMPSRRTVYLLGPPERSRRAAQAMAKPIRSKEIGRAPSTLRQAILPIITDRDNGTFSVEGPMTDDRSWNHAVVVAQKLGRQIRCSTAMGLSAEDTARNWLQRFSGKQVPAGEIVACREEIAPMRSQPLPGEASRRRPEEQFKTKR